MFGKKVLLKWKEPRFAYKYAKKQISHKQWLTAFVKFVSKFVLAGFIIAVVIELFRSSKIPHSNEQMLIFVSIFAVLGVILWILGLLIALKSPEISMTEKGLSIYEPPDKYSNIAYQEIQSYSIVKNKIKEKEYSILEIKNWNGETGFIEIDPNIKTEDIVEILKSKNIQVKPLLLKLT